MVLGSNLSIYKVTDATPFVPAGDYIYMADTEYRLGGFNVDPPSSTLAQHCPDSKLVLVFAGMNNTLLCINVIVIVSFNIYIGYVVTSIIFLVDYI